VSWHLPDGETFASSLVPHLSTNVSVEQGGRSGTDEPTVLVTGPTSARFDVDLRGAGWVVGLKFHPGAFPAVTGRPARELLDQTVPAGGVLAPDVVDALLTAAAAPDPDAVADGCVAAVRPLLGTADPAWTEARDLVRLIELDESVTTTADLAERSGRSERSLQRLFAQWIGLPPKQVVLRYRLQNVVAALDEDSGESIADLAARLGFFDQAHLTREFTAFVGISPGAYRAGDAVR